MRFAAAEVFHKKFGTRAFTYLDMFKMKSRIVAGKEGTLS